MELLSMYILVFLLAAMPFVEAIILTPIATYAGLAFIPVLLLAILGNLLTVYIVIIFVDKIKAWREKNGKYDNKRSIRARKLWKKYGPPGLALLGPFFVGSHLSAFLSLAFGGSKKQVTIWITISVTAWSTFFGLLAYFGIDWLNIDNQFIEQIFDNNAS
ncbi:small multi-drug export protein [Paraliobacillus sediminis]|uniref:small multi-drug export protein n=1 Tax=Paraliobacillus sediminis TaxID=1885916 RepID=UPI001F071FF8|nr:small multi-drug export protein [Paraliobacillus sediminis]